MPDLVTVQEAKTHLNMDEIDPDDGLADLIGAASLMVLNFIQATPGQFADGAPKDVKAAVCVLVGILRRNPDNDDAGAFAEGRLPTVVRACLRGYRRPICV